MLAYIKDKEQTDANVGFKFTNEDVIQWIDDLDFLIELYKKIFSVTHLSSSFKLRNLIKELTSYFLGTYNNEKRDSAPNPKQLIKDVFKEIQSVKVMTNKDDEAVPVSEIRLLYDLKDELRLQKSNKKSNKNIK